jgi:hypothetical protein
VAHVERVGGGVVHHVDLHPAELLRHPDSALHAVHPVQPHLHRKPRVAAGRDAMNGRQVGKLTRHCPELAIGNEDAEGLPGEPRSDAEQR